MAYSRTFNFVEVNSTFYHLPPLKEVERWRKLVPPSFEFSVRAHHSITHKYRFQPVEETFEALESMRRICSKLGAGILHLQMPPSFELTTTSLSDIRTMLSSIRLQKLRLALEIRGFRSSELPPKLVRIMSEFHVIHCVDLSKGEVPAYESDTLYTRLFGKGEHNVYQPTDEELSEIDHKATSGKSERIVMSFHFVKMYKDAARLKIYKQTGQFPKVTKSTGIASLEEVLSEDARFPSTKQELIHSQGWKVFDLDENSRARAKDLLERLPETTYGNLGEAIDILKLYSR